MHCPQCGVNISSPGKECPACSASLMQSCPHCQFKNLLEQQFCGSCGENLLAANAGGVKEVRSTPTSSSPLEGGVAYPVLSLELMNLELLKEKLPHPEQLNRITKDLMLRIEGQLASQNASVESTRENVMFFSFRQDQDLRHSLATAFKVGIALAKKTIRLQDVELQIRVGMDITHAQDRAPMAAVSERTTAKAGQLVVSHNIYKITHQQIPYEPIGPIQVQGQMKAFYRVLIEGQKPAPSPEPNATQETASDRLQGMQTPADPVFQATISSDTAMEQIQRKFEPAEHPKSFTYTPPEFISSQPGGKTGNIGYHQALQAIERDLKEVSESKEPQGRLIGLCGQEGSGKTTILSLIQAQMPQDSFVWIGGSYYETHKNNQFPLYYWLELWQNLVGMPMEGVPQGQGDEHLINVLKVLFGDAFSEDKLAFVKTLLSMTPLEPLSPEVRQGLGQMVPHLMSLFTSMAKTRPLVLVMENLEYADAASIELLLQLIHAGLLQSPIVVMLTYTPDVLFVGPLQQAMFLLPFKEYVLDTVDEDTLAAMGEPALSVPWKKLPENTRAQLMDKGMPMFLEEAFRWLQLKGGLSINAKSGKFSPEKKLKDLTVPEDIGDVIRDRFEHLDEAARYSLQVASVLGERFSTSAFADLAQVREKLEAVLQFLWQQGFITPDVGIMARFRHHLVWRAVYDTIEPETRLKLHQLAADYFKQAQTRGLSICPVHIAHQFTLAQSPAYAVPAWSQAGVWLARVGSVTGANLAFDLMQKQMAAGHIPPDPVQQRRLYESLAMINMDVQPEYSKNLLLTAMHTGGERPLAEELELQVFLAQTYERLGAYPQAVSTIHRAIESLPEEGSDLERIALGSQEMWLLCLQGRFQESRLIYSEEVKPYVAHMRPTVWEDPVYRMSFMHAEMARARTALMQCNPMAFSIIDNVLMQCNIFNETVMSIHFRLTRCLGFLMKGNYDACQRDMELLLGEIEALSNPPDLMVWWGLIVIMYHCDMGDWQNASMLVPNASYQAEQARDYLAWATCQALAGRISMGTGNHGEARKLLEQAVTVSAEYNLSQTALMGWRYVAENELTIGNIEMAENVCIRAIEVAQKPHNQNLYEFYQLIVTYAKILLAKNEPKQAGTLLEKHWPAMVKSGYTPLVAEAAFQISELYGKLAPTLPEPHRAKYLEQQASFLQKAKALWQEQGNKYRLAPFHAQERGVPIS